MEEKKKSNIGVIILLVVIILGLVGYIACDKLVLNKDTRKEEKKEEKKEWKDVTKDKNEYFNNILIILENSYSNSEDDEEINEEEVIGYPDYIYSKDEVKASDISIGSVFNYVFRSLPKKGWSDYSTDKYDEKFTGDLSSAKQQVKDLMGTDVIPAEMMGCPSFYYENNVLYQTARCGYGPGAYTIRHIYKIEEEKNTVKVYVAVGGVDYVDAENGSDKIDVYSDPNFKNKYSTVKENEWKTFDDRKQNVINDSNYKDFTKFVVEFSKNDNNSYKFVKSSKVK